MDSRLAAALAAIRSVAAADPDHVRVAHGCGFAKSDVTLGHRLASAHPSAFRNPALAQAIALAVRYRRQVSPDLRYDLRVTHQDDLFCG